MQYTVHWSSSSLNVRFVTKARCFILGYLFQACWRYFCHFWAAIFRFLNLMKVCSSYRDIKDMYNLDLVLFWISPCHRDLVYKYPVSVSLNSISVLDLTSVFCSSMVLADLELHASVSSHCMCLFPRVSRVSCRVPRVSYRVPRVSYRVWVYIVIIVLQTSSSLRTIEKKI